MRKWRQYREIEQGEYFVIFGDCAQGGNDNNAMQFMSYTKLDIPLVYHSSGVAATMTTETLPTIEKLYDITGVTPMLALERNNGGASEMERFKVMNRAGKFLIYTMHVEGFTEDKEGTKLGWDTTSTSRPYMLGDLSNAIATQSLTIYDKPTIAEMRQFIINKNGKPEAAKGANDDLVMSAAGAWQLYQRTKVPVKQTSFRAYHNKMVERGDIDW